MAQVINTNVASLTAQRNLNKSQNTLNTSLQRLSSGLRINSAKDDAAGLAISERMTSQIRGLDQAQRNANDGISLTQTAEGALASVGDMLQRMRELSVQASNATNSTADQTAIQAEVDQMLEEIDRVASQTKFNGISLLDGSFTTQAFQVGADSGQIISVAGIQSVATASLGGTTSTNTITTANALAGITAAGYGATVAAGTITVNGTDIGQLRAVGTAQERMSDFVSAVNRVSSTTGVAAVFDNTTGALTLRSDAAITVVGATAANSGLATLTSTAVNSVGLAGLSVVGFSNAQTSIDRIDSALTQINSARADLGAVQNRFMSTVSNLQTTSENLSASRSRIQDADFAAETSNLTKAQILQQAGTAMLAQAKALPQQVLSLLQ